MDQQRLDLESYYDPPSGWGTSLANVAEVMLPCLEAAEARSVAEVGAYAGDLTRLLCDGAAGSGAKVTAIDPAPQPGLVDLGAEREQLELIRQTSLDALGEIELSDAVIIDGDHNYWTVSEELRLIGERASGAELPLLMFHDVCWPHARRDDYFDAGQIHAEHRHPTIGEGPGLFPGEPEPQAGGLPYPRSAAHEGGSRNGVRTAVEDFVAAREGLRFVVVPAFFGFGVVFHEQARGAPELAQILDPLDSSSLLAGMEASRVHHLAHAHARAMEVGALRERLARQEAVLQRLLDSSAFAVAERLSRLRERAGVAADATVISKEELRRALGK